MSKAWLVLAGILVVAPVLPLAGTAEAEPVCVLDACAHVCLDEDGAPCGLREHCWPLHQPDEILCPWEW